MRETYHPQAIEARWQARWATEGCGQIDLDHAARPFYNLMEFPYLSGEGLHIGHVFSFGGADTYGRFMRRRGYDVFQPIGFDAFGIHTENYALRIGAHPRELTPRALARFRAQLHRLGAAFDWSRAVVTSDPGYYRWTQWIFVQLFKAGLAYRAEALVNWCPACQTVLANEQVVDGRCERCDTPMTQRRMAQWFLRITSYADRLLDFSRVDFSEAVIKRQQAWIGRSAGADVEFNVLSSEGAALSGAGPSTHDSAPPDSITVFTTRPETIFDVTFVALAPEHPLAGQIVRSATPQAEAVRAYIEAAHRRLELDRQQGEPGGVFTGLYAINPANGAHVPVWVADYVLMSYGTGAIMGVPAHDARDRRFAERYGLPLTAVDGRSTADARDALSGGHPRSPIVARPAIRYRLRDWLISRQRYWGPPIPIIYCDRCGTLPVPEEQLPVRLPPLEQFRPTGTGVAPLATVAEFVHTTCPRCGGAARRETEVSDTFLDSAWYFLRYTSTERDDVPWDQARVQKWLPVDLYTGGPEHATMHHLYARFIALALHDLGLLPIAELFARLRLHGMILHSGRKMSKSRGNVINPDEYIARYGADATRMALLFLGPFDADADVRGFERSVVGMARFLGRVWEVCQGDAPGTGNREPDERRQTPGASQPQTSARLSAIVRRVTDDLEAQRFHTAIAALMEYTGWLRRAGARMAPDRCAEARRTLVLLLAPFAPHIAEELWVQLGGAGSVHDQPWPAGEPEPTAATVELPVQVDGRLRGHINVAHDASADELRAAALACHAVQAAVAGRTVRRVIVVAGRVVNVVTDQALPVDGPARS